MELLIPLTTAVMLGWAHALEPDHVAAVSAFAVRRPQPRAAAGFGLRWAAGHGLAVVVCGSALLALHWHLPEEATAWSERAVGLVLIVLGAWTAWGAGHPHRHGHAHGHEHEPGPGGTDPGSVGVRRTAPHSAREHGHAATAVGILHGLAGAAPTMALLPLMLPEHGWLAPAALVSFAVGTAAAMVVFALAAGWAAGRAAHRSERVARWVRRLTGLTTCAVGVLWLLR